MANVSITIEIPEGDVARVKTAAIAFTGLPVSASAKELTAAAIKAMVVHEERQTNVIVPPAIV